MKNSEQYITHASGIYSLLAWNEDQQNIGTPTKISHQTIFIHPLTSRFFALGISKKKNVSKIPFLAIQPAESYWMKLISWDNAYIRERDMHLYLVSKLIKGDDNEFPDIPPFAIALSFDTLEKINILQKIEIIEGKEYRQESNEIKINFNETIFKIPVVKLKKDENYLSDSLAITNLTDIMHTKEKHLQSIYSTKYPPEFKGDINASSSVSQKYWKNLTDLLDKTKQKK